MQMKIGSYEDKEILEQLTKGDGNSFIGRSMYDAIINKLNEQQESYTKEFNFNKELDLENEELTNIINKAIEYIKDETSSMSAGLGLKKSINVYGLLDILRGEE